MEKNESKAVEPAKSASLLSLVDEVARIENALIESGGEITEEIQAMLKVQDLQLPEKVDAYAFVIERLEDASEFYARRAQAIQAIAKAAKTAADRCKDNLRFAMVLLDTDEINGLDFRFKLVTGNPACVIEDEALIDASYKTVVQTTSVDKKRVVADLKIGAPVPGARLEYTKSLRRYTTVGKKAVAR